VPPQKTKAEAVKALQRELRNLTLNYLEWQINEVAIRVINPDASVGKGGRSFIQASKAWVIVSPNTKTNCAFSACELSINRDKYKWLLEKGEKRLVQRSADLKQRVNPSNKKRTHMDDLQDIADYKKTEIVLYNNVFHKIRRFVPSGEISKKASRKLNRRPIEIQLRENHFVALLRRAEINEPWEAEVVVEEPESKSKVIQVKRKKYFRPYDEKFVAWDLECTGNGREGGVHVCYAMGLAWSDQYASFWGLGSSIKQGLDFIYENRERFDGHTFYAHNGGSYDAMFLFKEGLLEDDRFDIPEPPVDQDGKYIHFKVVVGGDTIITFRDSLRLLPQALEKLCKEFNVEHKKLTETVCHDDITVENWDSFPQLHKYLENDCKGLLECLACFSKEVFNSTAEDEFKGSEAYVRQLFAIAFGRPFVKVRPKFLEGLELDGYCEELKMAFEYDGEQHFKFPNWFHKTQEAFQKLQADDAKKTLLCEQHGIRLHRVPYWVKFEALPEFVSNAVGISVLAPFDPGRKVGINMTSCYTGASLAKKTIFAKHYKQLKYPIYTLAPSIDKFIRDFYRGGRVEIFHMGRVPRDKLYYLDFTSLYPWAGTKSLPYGEPVWVEKVDPKTFYGFVSVEVKSRPSMVGEKKPLHGLMVDGKFQFGHYKEFTPMNLFSEELKLGIQSGMYEYKIGGGWSFQSAPWMKSFFEEAFKRKAEAKKAGNKALAQVWKIIINSAYGFWGIRVEDKDSVLIQEKGACDIHDYINRGKFLNYTEIGKYGIARVLKDLPIKDFNVGVASAISSYSRCRLWSLIDRIESKGKRVFMCDTDSVITDAELNDYPDLMEEFMWDGCGDALGSLKNEADDHLKDCGWAKDDINRLREEEGGMLHFDALILGGCKFYCLRKKGCEDIAKCKGYKKSKGEELSFEDFEMMAGGGEKTQKQVQFLCPKMNHLSVDEKFSMRTPKVTKKFRFLYNKGVVHDDGTITSFYN
jgi:hypothetical protein